MMTLKDGKKFNDMTAFEAWQVTTATSDLSSMCRIVGKSNTATSRRSETNNFVTSPQHPV